MKILLMDIEGVWNKGRSSQIFSEKPKVKLSVLQKLIYKFKQFWFKAQEGFFSNKLIFKFIWKINLKNWNFYHLNTKIFHKVTCYIVVRSINRQTAEGADRGAHVDEN